MARQTREEEAPISLDPADMLQGGLKDDFRGRVIEARYVPWDYDGNIDHNVLAARLTIKPEEEDDPIVQHWSAGDLAGFMPSQDGKTPIDVDDATEAQEGGPYLVRVGKRAQLNNNTNFAHLMSSIIDSGAASKKFQKKDLTASLECLEGLDAHWNRMPQKKRSGLIEGEGGEGRRSRDVLLVTEVYGYGEDTGKSKPNGKAGKPVVAKGKPAPEPEADEDEDEGDDLDSRIEAAIVEALSESDGKLKKGKLANEILKRMAKDKEKAKAVKRVMEEGFFASDDRPWSFDEDKGILTL